MENSTVNHIPDIGTRAEPVPQAERSYAKHKICISGAAVTKHCPKNAVQMAQKLGAEIAKAGAVIVTGATTGMPYWAAKGAKEAGGLSVGFSPAASRLAHIKKYHLPIDFFDVIVYTGFNYAGRNLLLTRASDAVIVTCGRMGTLNEFTIAFEDNKPIGILDLPGKDGTVELIREIIETARRGPGKIVYDSDPRRLVQRVIAMIEEENVNNS